MSKIATRQPTASDGFSTSYTYVEVPHMLSQAQVLRIAALIIIHRMRYPFNVNNEPAHVMALSILTQLETTWLLTGSAVKHGEIALIVVLIKLKDDQGREQWVAKTSAVFGHLEIYTNALMMSLTHFGP